MSQSLLVNYYISGPMLEARDTKVRQGPALKEFTIQKIFFFPLIILYSILRIWLKVKNIVQLIVIIVIRAMREVNM